MLTNARINAAHAFVRSLNILLKFARMYDFSHPRTEQQRAVAWQELRTALGSEPAGLLLAVSGDQLLLDGIAMETAAGEKSFARMMASAGIASIHFAHDVAEDSLARFVKAFPASTNTKPGQIAEQLKAALRDDPHIHVNEICFVPADSAVAKTTVTAELAARSLGMNPEDSEALLKDPSRLLQLITSATPVVSEAGPAYSGDGAELEERWTDGRDAAGTGSSRAPGGDAPAERSGAATSAGQGKTDAKSSSGPGAAAASRGPAQSAPPAGIFARMIYGAELPSGPPPGPWQIASGGIREANAPRPTGGSLTMETGFITLQHDEMRGILRVLTEAARGDDGLDTKLDSMAFQSRLSRLPRRARYTLNQALAALAAQAPAQSADKPALLRLAEHVAIHSALQNYKQADAPSAVRQKLAEMNREIEALRKLARDYESKLASTGIDPGADAARLDEEFWARVDEEKKRAALDSSEAWCVPGPKVREFAEQLIARGEMEGAEKILRNYANCMTAADPEARREAAAGILDLAALCARSAERLFLDVIRVAGIQAASETDPQAQTALRKALARFAQEAVSHRSYAGMRRLLEMLDYLESEGASGSPALRSQITIEDRLPEFIEEAVRARQVPQGLFDLLRRVPRTAAAQVAARFGRVGFREDCELLLSIIERLGTGAVEQIQQQFERGSVPEALDAVPILARLDPARLQRELPERMRAWPRAAHDRLVRQIAASGAAERARLLADIFEGLDALIQPLAVDEIGMTSAPETISLLLRLAAENSPNQSREYLRIKAIEALGRLGVAQAAEMLQRIATARRAWRWANPAELRIVSLQALARVDRELAKAASSGTAFTEAELALAPLNPDPSSTAIRQRRYARLRLAKALPAFMNAKEQSSIIVPEISLGGGIAVGGSSFHPGSVALVRISAAQRLIRMQAIMRDANTKARAFEIVDISYEERWKLRKFLIQLGSTAKDSRLEDRTHSMTRMVAPGAAGPSPAR